MSNAIVEIHAHDVLFGKGKGSYQHEGNVIFRKLIDTYKDQYLSCKKNEKRNLAISTVNAIKFQSPPGRFLELGTSVGTIGSWIEVSDERAIEKTCQTFRKKRNNTSSTISFKSIEMKAQDRYRSNYLDNMNGFDMKNNSLFSTSLSSIEYVPNSFRQLDDAKTKECAYTTFTKATIKTEQNPEVDLSVHNDIILANLQQYYRDKHERSPLDDHISQCLNEIYKVSSNQEVKKLNAEDIKLRSQEHDLQNNNYFPQKRNECDDDHDDDVLRLLVEWDHDSTINNDIAASVDDNIKLFTNKVFI